MKLKLYGAMLSPFVRKVRVMLALKKINYDIYDFYLSDLENNIDFDYCVDFENIDLLVLAKSKFGVHLNPNDIFSLFPNCGEVHDSIELVS